MDSLAQIDQRILELNKKLEAEFSIEERIMRNIADHLKKKRQLAIPETPPKELMQKADETVELLQLQPNEVEFFKNQVREFRLVNPCYIPMHSPNESRCQFDSVSCGSYKSLNGTTYDTSVACDKTTEFNIKSAAYGYNNAENTPQTSSATVYAWAWFDYPRPYPTPTSINVYSAFVINGFYRIESAQYPSMVRLTLMLRGYQYGYLWGTADSVVLTQNGDINGRFDSTKVLSFSMPVGADPFQMLVMVKLEAIAKGQGTWAIADFRSGANKISIPYVNTYSV
jgi:hypothetical protein